MVVVVMVEQVVGVVILLGNLAIPVAMDAVTVVEERMEPKLPQVVLVVRQVAVEVVLEELSVVVPLMAVMGAVEK